MRGAIIIQKMYIGLETSRCNSLMMTAQRIFVTDFFSGICIESPLKMADSDVTNYFFSKTDIPGRRFSTGAVGRALIWNVLASYCPLTFVALHTA